MEEKQHLYFKLDALSIAFYSPISFLSFLLASTGSELSFKKIISLGFLLTLFITGILVLILWIQKYIEGYRSIRRIEVVLPLIFVGLIRAFLITIILVPNFSSFAENLYARIPVSVLVLYCGWVYSHTLFNTPRSTTRSIKHFLLRQYLKV